MSLAEQLADMGFVKNQMYDSNFIRYSLFVYCFSDSAINTGKVANLEQAIDWYKYSLKC